MLPLRDDIPSRGVPLVTIALMAINLIVFLYQLSLELGAGRPEAATAQAFVFEFGVVPCRLTGACRVAADVPGPALTIFTSMFLHGGVLHLLGNMLYLWIFGDNVEDTLGHVRFLALYLASGVAAVFMQTLVTPTSGIPMIGASGAVSGVLGAYLLLFPRAGVSTLVVLGFFIRMIRVPAVLVLGFWIALQLVGGLSVLGRDEVGGIAWFAHVGGFGAGMLLLFLLRRRARRRL